MRNKNYSFMNILTLTLLLLAAVSSISSCFSQPQEVVQEPLLETQQDITVEIISAKVINTGMEIGTCYTAPDNGEWRPIPGRHFYGEAEIYPDEIEFLPDEILADGKNFGERCALIRYRIDDLSTITTPIQFSILRFYAPGREMYSPCEELQQRLDTSPKAQSYGLKVKCEDKEDFSMSVELLENNKSVTTEEAQKVLDSIVSAEIIGTWEFTITNIEK